MNRRTITLLLCATALVSFAVSAASPYADRSFGSQGVAQIPGTFNQTFAMRGLRDGSVAVVLGMSLPSGDPYSSTPILTKLTSSGTVDTSFGRFGFSDFGSATSPAAVYSIHPTTVFEDPQGRLVVAGSGYDGLSFPFPTLLTRFTARGQVDLSFGPEGTAVILKPKPSLAGPALDDVVQFFTLADGKYLVVTQRAVSDGFGDYRPSDAMVTRLGGGGTVDTQFGNMGFTSVASTAYSARLQSDGSVKINGTRGLFPAVSSVSQDGTPGATTSAPTSLPSGSETHGQEDGSLIAILHLTNGGKEQGLEVRTPTGELDTTFGNDGRQLDDAASRFFQWVWRTPDGGIVAVTPAEYKQDGGVSARLCIWRSNGKNESCELVQDGGAGAAHLAPDGSLYLSTPFLAANQRVSRFTVVAPNVEYYNSILGHYFVTYDGVEGDSIDRGDAGPGWSRTGISFKAGGTTPVCRFYGTPGIGSNSHFFTISTEECELVKKDPGWTFEGYGFYATPAVNGQCEPPLTPVYRLYNNRAAQRDSNHRHITDLSLVPVMVTQGWSLEGVAFCVRP